VTHCCQNITQANNSKHTPEPTPASQQAANIQQATDAASAAAGRTARELLQTHKPPTLAAATHASHKLLPLPRILCALQLQPSVHLLQLLVNAVC
jgi:hypothetical protein